MSKTSPVKICHLYPEMLNLYGDMGNIICLHKRLLWRGIPCEIVPVRFGEKLKLSDIDMVFVGGGQDFEQEILLGDLKGNKANEIKAAVADGMPLLAICGGYQMLGHYYKDAQGKTLDYLGIVDFYTVASKKRMVGNLAFSLNDDPSTLILGFENHGGKTYLGEGVSSLGRVVHGYGNDGEDKTEGIRCKNVFGTYCHGPVLPKNPALADLVLKEVLIRTYGSDDALTKLDDSTEHAAHDEALNSILRHHDDPSLHRL